MLSTLFTNDNKTFSLIVDLILNFDSGMKCSFSAHLEG